MNLHKYRLLTILGPTASGKTLLAAHVANRIGGEIISADSRQVYRKMNIGTGKDYNDYIVNNIPVPYHLVDIADPGYKYNVFEFQNDFLSVYEDIVSREKFPVLCGGTGLYIEAVTKGYRLINVPVNQYLRDELGKLEMDELSEILVSFRKLHNKTDIVDKKRLIRAIEIEKFYAEDKVKDFEYPEIKNLYVGILPELETRRKIISIRLATRPEQGLIHDVDDLLKSGVSKEDLCYYGLEYKYITNYLTCELDYSEMSKRLEIAIHQFAKRQMTWFRGMERRGLQIHWINEEVSLNEKVDIIIDLLKKDGMYDLK